MDQGKIVEVLELQGNEAGAVKAIRNTTNELKNSERQATSFGQKLGSMTGRVGGFLDNILGGAKKFGAIAAGGFALGAKGMGALGAASGIASASLLKVNLVAGLAASTIGALVGEGARLAGMSDQADRLGKTLGGIKNQLVAPLVHAFADAFARLDALLQTPAVQKFIRDLSVLIAYITQVAIRVIGALAGAIIALWQAFSAGDFVNLFSRVQKGWVDGWKAAGSEAGKGAGATFTETFNEEFGKAGGGKARGGFLKNIGDLGTNIINTLLAGFKRADFDVLDQAAAAITARLQTLFKRGEIAEITIVPRTVIAQTAVAQALKEMNDAGGLNAEIIARVRGRLESLGAPVQDYVEQLLRAREATKQVEAATAAIKAAGEALVPIQAKLLEQQQALAGIQEELAAAEKRAAEEAAKLLPISDALRDDQQALAQIIIDQIPRQEELTRLAEEQEDLEAEIYRLEQAQAQALAALAPLREQLAAATAAQAEAEGRLRDAQDAMIPIQERLSQLREEQARQTQEIEEREKARAEALKQSSAQFEQVQAAVAKAQQDRADAIQDAQNALEDSLKRLEASLSKNRNLHAGELADLQKIIDQVNERWRTEIEGAQRTLDIATKALAVEERRMNLGQLQFARDRARAQGIGDDNQRIAALARIDRARAQYLDRNKDALEAAQLEAKVQEDLLKTIEAKRDAEKGDAPARIADLQKLIAQEEALIKSRVEAARAEGNERIEKMKRAAELQARADRETLATAKARHEQVVSEIEGQRAQDQRERERLAERMNAVQAEANLQQKEIDRIGREVELDRRKVETAQTTLANAEAAAKAETQGAIDAANTRRAGLVESQRKLEDQLGDERRELEQNIVKRQADLDLRKSKLDEQAEIEQRPIQARLAAAAAEVAASEKLVKGYEDAIKSAEIQLTKAQQFVDKYQEAADLAQARVEAEARNAELLDQQRQLLDQIAQQQEKTAGGAGGGAPKFGGAPPNFGAPISQEEIEGMGTKLAEAWTGFVDTVKKTDWKGLGGPIVLEIATALAAFVLDNPFTVMGGIIGRKMGGAAGAALGLGLGQFLDNDPAGDKLGLPIMGASIGQKLGGPIGIAVGLMIGRGIQAWKDSDWLGVMGTFHFLFPNPTDFLPKSERDKVNAIFQKMFQSIFDPSSPDYVALRDKVAPWLHGLIDHLKLAVPAFPDWARDQIAGVGRAFNEGFENIKLEVGSWPGKITEALAGMAGALTQPFQDAYNKLLGNSIIPDIINGAIEWFLKLPTEIPKALGNMAKDALGHFTNLELEGGKSFGELVTGVLGKGKNLVDNLEPKFQAIYNDAVGYNGWWTKFTGGVGEQFSGVVKKVTQPGTGEMDTLKKGVNQGFSDIKSAADSPGGPLLTFIGGLFTKFSTSKDDIVGTKASSVFSLLAAGVRGGFSGIKTEQEAPSSPLSGIVDGIRTKFGLAKKDVAGDNPQDQSSIIARMGQGLYAGLSTMAVTLLGEDGPVVSVVKAIINPFGKIPAEVAGTDPGKGGFFPGLIAGIQTGFELMSSSSIFAEGKGLRKFLTDFKAVWDEYIGGQDDPAKKVNHILFNMFQNPEGFMGKLSSKLTLSFKTLMDTPMREAIAKFGTDLNTEFGKIANAQREAAGGAYLLGKAIAEGIAAGIEAFAYKISAAVEAAVEAAKQAGDIKAGAQSPAKLFIPTGKNMGLGIAVGVDQAVSAVERAVRGLVGAARAVATADLVPAFSVPLGRNDAMAGVIGLPGGSTPLPGRGGDNFNAYNVNIYDIGPENNLQAQEWWGMVTGR